MEADSAEIFDFLYVDRARISSLYAQLFSDGTLTGFKRTAQQSSSEDQNVGSDIKILKLESKSADVASEAVEHVFDPSWSVPLEVLSELTRRSKILASCHDCGLGSLVLEDCYLRVIDYSSLDKLWEPAILAASLAPEATVDPKVVEPVTQVLKALPAVIHAHFFPQVDVSGLRFSPLI